MARGSVAKKEVEKRIAAAFGTDFVGVVDNKVYVYADDGGERVQIAIAMTCPKVEVATSGVLMTGPIDVAEAKSAKVTVASTVEDDETIERLMKELGL